MEAQRDLPKQEGGVEKPWCELVCSFSGATAGVYEAPVNIQGFQTGYESDTDTGVELLHEDELDEMCSLGPSDPEGMLACSSNI